MRWIRLRPITFVLMGRVDSRWSMPAFFAQGLLRSEEGIWLQLDDVTRKRIIENFISSRKIKPGESNWLMFSATIEAALLHFTGECEMGPIEYALKKHKEWYKGDGWYGDGPNFHFDYYNSYVIQPMLMDVLEVLREKNMDPENFYDVPTEEGLIRYAEQQEKMIHRKVLIPIIRSIGCFSFWCIQAAFAGCIKKRTSALYCTRTGSLCSYCCDETPAYSWDI